MITFFTTTKDFLGAIETTQQNAIQSWFHSLSGTEIIIFGDAYGMDKLPHDQGIILYPSVQRSEEGTPRIDDMFLKAQEIASNSICCFINADIVITHKFSQVIQEIHRIAGSNYLAVGQREDVSIDFPIEFTEQWGKKIDKIVEESGRLHPPAGSDFFAFPKGQYAPGDIPGLLVGRAGWDLWMIYHGRTQNFKVVDISPTISVVHQNHDYAHRKKGLDSYNYDAEAQLNLHNLPMGETYPYTLMACNYIYKNGIIRRNFARCHLRWFLSYELHLRRNRSPFKEIRAVLKHLKLVR